MPVFPFRLAVAALFVVLATPCAAAQSDSAARGTYDSITVTKVSFPGAMNVSTDDFRRLIFTRPSPCRLPFLFPLCAQTLSQLVTDRRRTTNAALGEDITKIRVYYWQRGFREAQVDTVLTEGKLGTAVAFKIVEGRPTTVGALTVTQRVSILSEKELSDLVLLREGEPLSIIALDSTLAHIKVALWNKGYADARIDTTVPRPDASNVVPVKIHIDARWLTRVGRVEFEGNHYLSGETLRRGVMLQPGTVYTRDAVLESQRRLFQSPAIARAVAITPSVGDSVKTVTIAVSETPRRYTELTAGFNTIDYGQVALVARHNALGAGRWVSLRAAAGNLFGEQLNGAAFFHESLPNNVGGDPQGFLDPTYQATLTLTQPWIAGARTSAAVSLFAGRRSLANVVIDEDAGATVGLVHDLAPRAPIGINYRFESTRVQGSAVYYCAGYGVCDAATRAALVRRQRLSPLGVSAWVDRADDLEVPTRGYTGVVDAEHASSATGSTFGHNRISADGSLYRAYGSRKIIAGIEQTPKVLAFHIRGGYVKPLSSDRAALGVAGSGDGILHPRARFYAGGMQSVRGFAENELGPTILQVRRASLLSAGCTDASVNSGQCDPSLVPSNQFFSRPIGGSTVAEANVEARLPLGKALVGVVFVDGAYVGVNGLSSIAKGAGAVTPGGGFRYRSPLGVLRLDFGLRPVGSHTLPVVVSATDIAGNDQIIRLTRDKSYSPVDPSPGALRSIARRIVVHFAMGQAF